MGKTLDELIDDAYDLNDEAPGDGHYDYPVSRIIGNRGYKAVCRRGKCAKQPFTLTTVIGTREYAFPDTDAGKIVAVRLVKYLATGATDAVPLDIISINRVNTWRGSPAKYYINDTYVGVDPIPDGAYSLPCEGYEGPSADIAGGIEPDFIPDDWQWVLSYFIVRGWAEMDEGKDPQTFIKWNSLYEEALGEMVSYFKTGTNAGRLPAVV